jgi:hypothetical protein
MTRWRSFVANGADSDGDITYTRSCIMKAGILMIM